MLKHVPSYFSISKRPLPIIFCLIFSLILHSINVNGLRGGGGGGGIQATLQNFTVMQHILF